VPSKHVLLCIVQLIAWIASYTIRKQ